MELQSGESPARQLYGLCVGARPGRQRQQQRSHDSGHRQYPHTNTYKNRHANPDGHADAFVNADTHPNQDANRDAGVRQCRSRNRTQRWQAGVPAEWRAGLCDGLRQRDAITGRHYQYRPHWLD